MDVSISDLEAALAEGARLVDVREDDEYASGHVAGAEHVPMRTVPAHLDELRGDGVLYVICAVGARSAVVAEFLEGQGISAVNVDGGMHAWLRAGLPVQTGPAG
jgi:rhodanese-related sulfurtransferase